MFGTKIDPKSTPNRAWGPSWAPLGDNVDQASILDLIFAQFWLNSDPPWGGTFLHIFSFLSHSFLTYFLDTGKTRILASSDPNLTLFWTPFWSFFWKRKKRTENVDDADFGSIWGRFWFHFG